MAYAPDLWSSYIYAAAAGRLAHILRGIDNSLAATYSNSALRAMLYAEHAHATSSFAQMRASAQYAIRDARNAAACEMFRMTGDIDWHVLYAETSVLSNESMRPQDNGYDQDVAAFSYLLSTQPMASGTIKSRYRKIFRNYADEIAARGDHTAFRWSKDHPYMPLAYGVLSTPPAYHLFRAHYLTGNTNYLAAGIECMQYAAGANPLNAAFTTGLGTNAVEYPLHIDARNSGQFVAGITVYGPLDIEEHASTGTPEDDWCFYWYMRVYSYPMYTAWPTAEAYFDTDIHPAECEFTVQQTMGESALNWGYLSAATAPIPEPCGGVAAVVLAALWHRRTK
jgi:endoglucanase